LIVWLFGCLVVWLFGRLVVSLFRCLVAWLFLSSLVLHLDHLNKKEAQKKLIALLDFVCLGSLSDRVSFYKSLTNRALVKRGMKMINQKKRPCWQALASLLSSNQIISQENISFKFIPLVNSASRIDNPLKALELFLSNNYQEALEIVNYLNRCNVTRQNIQKSILSHSIDSVMTSQQNKYSICLFNKDYHLGVTGLVASLLVDKFAKISCLFATGKNKMIVGSIRSIKGIDIIEILTNLNKTMPGLLICYGGHKGAAGVTIREEHLEQFAILLEKITTNIIGQSGESNFFNIQLHDGSLKDSNLSQVYNALEFLEPFGDDFPIPLFHDHFHVISVFHLKDTHLKFELLLGNQLIKGIWFQAKKEIKVGHQISALYRLQKNFYYQSQNIEIIIDKVKVHSL
jgi:single-stranded-DNA-specific exonuclease